MFKVTTTVEPVTEPVSVDEFKEKMQITHTEDDNRIFQLIQAVRQKVEKFCGIAIGEQTKQWVYDFDNAPASYYATNTVIRDSFTATETSIPYGPVVSISSVHKRNGFTYSALTGSDYNYEGGVIYNLSGVNKVTYVTGHDPCPADLKEGIMVEMAYRYENRGETNMEGFSKEALDYLIKYKDLSWE